MKRLELNYLAMGIIAVVLAWAFWFYIPWHGIHDDKLSQIQSRGILRVSTIDAPLSYSNANSPPTGFDYELAKRFADYLGVKLVIRQRKSLDELFRDLDNGDADLLAAGLVYDKARLTHFNAGPAYYYVSQRLVYRLGQARPKNLGALQGKFMVAAGSTNIALLQQLQAKKFPKLKWEVSPDQSSKDLLMQVAEGKLPYTLADSATIGLLQRVYPRLAVAFDVTEEDPVTWYLPKQNSGNLSAALLDFFSGLDEDGSIARLEEKYLGHVGSFDYVDTKTFLASIDATLPALQSLFVQYAAAIDWKLLAAISYQESHWDPQAVSPTGVRGLMMLTRNTADSLGITDRLDAEQSIRGGAMYLSHMLEKVPDTVPDDEKIWFALTAYNMGYSHMLDARALTAKQQGNPDSWGDVKLRLPMLSQPRYYQQTTYGYARGQQAYHYVENIRRYEISLVGYLQEKEKRAAQQAIAHTEGTPAAYSANNDLNLSNLFSKPVPDPAAPAQNRVTVAYQR